MGQTTDEAASPTKTSCNSQENVFLCIFLCDVWSGAVEEGRAGKMALDQCKVASSQQVFSASLTKTNLSTVEKSEKSDNIFESKYFL